MIKCNGSPKLPNVWIFHLTAFKEIILYLRVAESRIFCVTAHIIMFSAFVVDSLNLEAKKNDGNVRNSGKKGWVASVESGKHGLGRKCSGKKRKLSHRRFLSGSEDIEKYCL